MYAKSVRPKSAETGVNIAHMQTVDFKLSQPHVELCQLLKLAGIAQSGGAGKQMVAAGEVSVDGQPESRKKAKIRAGQAVKCRGLTILVKAS